MFDGQRGTAGIQSPDRSMLRSYRQNIPYPKLTCYIYIMFMDTIIIDKLNIYIDIHCIYIYRYTVYIYIDTLYIYIDTLYIYIHYIYICLYILSIDTSQDSEEEQLRRLGTGARCRAQHQVRQTKVISFLNYPVTIIFR
jgi:hypothetical protein